jgi:hypothetical protein
MNPALRLSGAFFSTSTLPARVSSLLACKGGVRGGVAGARKTQTGHLRSPITSAGKFLKNKDFYPQTAVGTLFGMTAENGHDL